MNRGELLAASVLSACLAFACGDSDGDGDGDDDGARDAGAAGATGADADSVPFAGSASPAPVSFVNDIAPILAGKCTDCHHDVVPTHLDLTDPFDAEVGAVNNPSTWDEEQLL